MLCLPEHGSDGQPAMWKPDYRLQIETNAERTCVWVRGETDRMAGERVAIAWNDGFVARFNPLRIYDETGTEVWQEGETKYLRAWWDNSDHGDSWPRRHIPAECRTEQVLWTMDTPHNSPRRHRNRHMPPESTTTNAPVLDRMSTP